MPEPLRRVPTPAVAAGLGGIPFTGDRRTVIGAVNEAIVPIGLPALDHYVSGACILVLGGRRHGSR